LAVLVLATVVWADLWLVARPFFAFSPPAAVSFGTDRIVEQVRQTPAPYRVLDAGLYPYSWLMAAGVPNLLGHHGNEFRYFDDLLGGQGAWSNLNRSTLDLYAVRFILHRQPGPIPRFHRVLGPVETNAFGTGYLFEADSTPPYARVVAGAVKIPEEQLVPTAADPRFPPDRLAIYPDTITLDPEPIYDSLPAQSPLTAEVTDWRPGRMRIAIHGRAVRPQYLVVAENWYSDWHATVDSTPTAALRAQNALLSVVLPVGAREVILAFDSRAYRIGRWISGLSLSVIMGLFTWSLAGSGPARSERPAGPPGPTRRRLGG
jgi:hypothetical protein